MSGFEIVSLLRKDPALKEIPVIAMTAHIMECDRQQAFAAGVNQMMAKPISYDEIAKMLALYAKKDKVS